MNEEQAARLLEALWEIRDALLVGNHIAHEALQETRDRNEAHSGVMHLRMLRADDERASRKS